MRNSAVVILIGCATLAMFFETSMAETLCPYCVCLPSYSPVCGRMKETGKLRGFSSRCVLECTNKCRKNKYEFFASGRCGKALTKVSQLPLSDASTAATTVSLLPLSDASAAAATPMPTKTLVSMATESPMVDSTQTEIPNEAEQQIRRDMTTQSDSDQELTTSGTTN